MDYWVRKTGHKFAWRDVLQTVEDPKEPKVGFTPCHPAP
ncbi:hypothetical protein BH11GEM1_BH11GEM1_10890 [soil metagenome]